MRRTKPDAGAGKQPPSNASNPWSLIEDDRLSEDFDAGMSMDQLTENNRQTRGAIRSPRPAV
jgi:hypothetical protein